jgi:hypothetical protein
LRTCGPAPANFFPKERSGFAQLHRIRVESVPHAGGGSEPDPSPVYLLFFPPSAPPDLSRAPGLQSAAADAAFRLYRASPPSSLPVLPHRGIASVLPPPRPRSRTLVSEV